MGGDAKERPRGRRGGPVRRRFLAAWFLVPLAWVSLIGSAEAALAVEQAVPPSPVEQVETAPEQAEAPAGPNRLFWGLGGVLGLFLLFQVYLGIAGRKCRIIRATGILEAAADDLEFYRIRLGKIAGEIGAALEGPASALREIDPVCPYRSDFLERLRVEAAMDGGDRDTVREMGACRFELEMIGRDLDRLGGGGNGSPEEWRRLLERVEATRRRLNRTGERIEKLAGVHRARLRRLPYRMARC